MAARQALSANFLRCAAAAAIAASALIVDASPSAAADLLRRYHHRHHRHSGLAIYRDDRVCLRYEPRDYRPRTVDDPLCYAARPYGISQHLYDHSTLLDRVDDSYDEY